MNNEKKISRRQFLKIIAAVGVGAAGIKLGIDQINKNETMSETRLLMGTIVNFTIVGTDKQSVQEAITATMSKMEALEDLLSRFKTNSQLSQLNREGELANADEAVLYLITQSRKISEESNGAFDITIKPLIDLYQRTYMSGKGLPVQSEINEVLEIVDYQNLEVSGNFVKFAKPRMEITLDGIAKGYIVDKGVEVLRSLGFANVMVEAGGDLLTSGLKDSGLLWNIGIQSPRISSGGIMEKFTLSDKAAATSGDYMQSFSDDFSQHHIIDPRTGYSAPQLASTTVVAKSALMADALATTVMVLGAEDGLALIRNLVDCEAYVVTKDLESYRTTGF